MRKAIGIVRGESDLFENGAYPSTGRLARERREIGERPQNRRAHGLARIERRYRDSGTRSARAPRNARSCRRSAAAMSLPSKRMLPLVGIEQADDRAAQRRLTAAAFADEAERLACGNGQRHAGKCVHARGARDEPRHAGARSRDAPPRGASRMCRSLTPCAGCARRARGSPRLSPVAGSSRATVGSPSRHRGAEFRTEPLPSIDGGLSDCAVSGTRLRRKGSVAEDASRRQRPRSGNFPRWREPRPPMRDVETRDRRQQSRGVGMRGCAILSPSGHSRDLSGVEHNTSLAMRRTSRDCG